MMSGETKQQYRSRIKSLIQIMILIADSGSGSKISVISRSCKMSHDPTVEKVQFLIEKGLVVESKEEKENLFKATEKGIKFKNGMEEFISFLKQFELADVL